MGFSVSVVNDKVVAPSGESCEGCAGVRGKVCTVWFKTDTGYVEIPDLKKHSYCLNSPKVSIDIRNLDLKGPAPIESSTIDVEITYCKDCTKEKCCCGDKPKIQNQTTSKYTKYSQFSVDGYPKSFPKQVYIVGIIDPEKESWGKHIGRYVLVDGAYKLVKSFARNGYVHFDGTSVYAPEFIPKDQVIEGDLDVGR